MEKSRQEIVCECATAVITCFQHYADQKVDIEVVDQILTSLDSLLPRDFTISEWSNYSDDYDQHTKTGKWPPAGVLPKSRKSKA